MTISLIIKILLDYGGLKHTLCTLPICKFRSIYISAINVPEHLHNIRSLLSVTYDYYEVENKGFSDKETFTGFYIATTMISIQILKNNGAFILVNIESFVLEKNITYWFALCLALNEFDLHDIS